jgi:hypothetical protein
MFSPVLQMPTFASQIYPLSSKLGYLSAFVVAELNACHTPPLQKDIFMP